MILENYKDFPRQGRILGLDWGARRCGIAVSDERQDFVFIRPQISVKNQDELQNTIIDFIKNENVVGIVIGLPLHANGTDSETTVQVRVFANNLSHQTDLPIIFIEENLTSVMAEEEMGQKSWVKKKSELDSVSAKVILENAIAVIKRI